MLKLDQINAYYGDLQTLWGVSLEVNSGELVALVGPNGAGKTTTLKVITGLLKLSSGSVTFDGNNPLSGREVIYQVRVLLVRDATPEEREYGGKVEANPER